MERNDKEKADKKMMFVESLLCADLCAEPCTTESEKQQ